MQKVLIIFSILISPGFGLWAQQQTLDQYIKIGLEQNLSLEQKRISLEQAHLSLDESRGGLLPTRDFKSRYTKATGGRDFVFPTADLMNPVYTALNNISGENQFPQIENEVFS